MADFILEVDKIKVVMVKFESEEAFHAKLAEIKPLAPGVGARSGWNPDNFRRASDLIFGTNVFQYKITGESLILAAKTPLEIYCSNCKLTHNSFVKYHFHIYREKLLIGTGCPHCKGKYTPQEIYDKLIERYGRRFNGEAILTCGKYKLTFEDLINVTCNDCGVSKFIRVELVGAKGKPLGCKNCNGNVPWTIARLLERSREVYGNVYTYRTPKEPFLRGGNTVIEITHKRPKGCGHTCKRTIHKHINKRKGCSSCYSKSSIPEVACTDVLKALGYTYTKQFRIGNCRYMYDFLISKKNQVPILLEIDGGPHFKQVTSWGTEEDFLNRQTVDVMKTVMAIENGYSLIRIQAKKQLSYDPMYNYIKLMFETAISQVNLIGHYVYFSHPDDYRWIIESEEFQELIQAYS